MVSQELIRAHLQDRVEDLALHRCLYKDLNDEEWRFFLQQVEGYSRTKDKLPLFAHRLEDGCRTRHAYSLEDGASAYSLEARGDGWWYPPRISCEQCSSEATARYKAAVLSLEDGITDAYSLEFRGKRKLIDLTGGAGVDTYFMSEGFDTVDYVEQNEELCRLARHNLPEKVSVHNCLAEEWLAEVESQKSKVESQKSKVERCQTTIFIDPARRDKNGGKVFKLADCTPNVVELLPRMREVADTILIKLSPMLDITEALRELGGDWQVHVVAVKNEVKEVLLCSNSLEFRGRQPNLVAYSLEARTTAVDLAEGWTFEFTREEETNAECRMHNAQFTNLQIDQFTNSFLHEPCAAILKAGAYKLVGARYGLEKLGVNTHLYVSKKLVNNFPGRIWKIIEVIGDRLKVKGEKANVLTRNYPLTAEQLKKKLRVKDGGEQYIIGTRVVEKPILLLAERIF